MGACVGLSMLAAVVLSTSVPSKDSRLGDPPAPPLPPPNLAQSILLTDAVTTHGARCLDGSPQRLWYQPARSAVNSSKWYFHFMGGGWCESLEACTERAYSPSNCYRGSSSVECFMNNGDRQPGVGFNQTLDFRNVPCINGARWGGGLLMGAASTNPTTHDWNKVEIVYCDGGSYSGNNETATMVTYNGKTLPLYFRGQRNLEATIDYLEANLGLDKATHFVVSGDSAGGLASYWHADWFTSRLPHAQVLVAPDSGFFLGWKTKPAWPQSLQWIVNQMNGTAGLDASCVDFSRKYGRDPAVTCTLPEDVSKHIDTPLFVMNSRFDPAMRGISTGGADPNEIGPVVIATVNESVLQGRPRNVAFITSCAEHCGQWAQGQVLENHNDFNVTIDGTTAPFAFDSWASSLMRGELPRRTTWIQKASYPCRTCCSGGNA